MATSRLWGRFPSRREILLMFAACAFPVHTWSIVMVLRELPAWMLRMKISDLIGVVAYPLVFALLESLIILAVSLLVAAILPPKWARGKIVALTAAVVFLAAAWVVAAQLNYDVVRTWPARSFVPWLAACLVSLAVACFLVLRYRRLDGLLVSFVDRLLILAYVYLFFDVASVLVVVARNVGGMAWQS